MNNISGACDRVSNEYLMAKLYRTGIRDTYLNFLNSYLEPHVGRVAIEGSFSDLFEFCDTVFQGTVLGSPLWNTFFADIRIAVSSVTPNQ